MLFASACQAHSQCECTDCPVPIVGVSTTSSDIDISGANNPTLDVNGQQVCQICIEVIHDAIREVDMVLIAPDGSSVDLMINTSIDFGTDMMFEICFVSCDQSADPDSGFPAVFDTDAGWMDQTLYDGSYYPASGCLEDLSGPVDGTWTLEMTDGWILEDGFLNDWYLVFADDSGLGCANSGACGSGPTCIADGGDLPNLDLMYCEGDPNLNIDEDPIYNGTPPPSADYDYTYVIVNTDTDVIEDITMDTDMTGYDAGNYEICGLSYLIDDAGNLPGADGSLTVDDIQDDIDNDVYCADLSETCFSVTIEAIPEDPDFQGPTSVCAGELVEYEIVNYDPNFTYLINIVGSFAQFIEIAPGVWEVIWIAGPGELCVDIVSNCGSFETCLTIDVTTVPDVEIDGNFEPCPGDIVEYIITPSPPSGLNYIYTATGGTIVNQTSSTVEIEWPLTNGNYEVCVEVGGLGCNLDPICEDVDIDFDYQIPTELNAPLELCLGDIGTAFIDPDADIVSYNWTSTNLDILSGNGTETVDFEGAGVGLAEICLELVTICDTQGPVCESLNILEVPDPQIETIDPTCDLEVLLESNANSSNQIQWTQLDGPNANIINETEANTLVELTNAGTYIFEITETNSICEDTDVVTVELLPDLTTSNPEFDCNSSSEYQVSFEILTGALPYQVNGITISSSDYTSEFIPSDEPFEFIIIDALGCMVTVEGIYECPCISNAGTMSNATIELCVADEMTFEATWNDDGTLDIDDIGLYFLHDNDDNELGNILDFNENGLFEYDAGNYELETSYYISYVVGNEDGASDIDLSDPCLSVSIGQEVIFFDQSSVMLDFESVVCSNELEINGIPDDNVDDLSWDAIQGPGNAQFSDFDNVPTTVTVDSFGSYTLELEIENEACISFQQIELNFSNGPTILNIQEICNANDNAYIVEFELIGDGPFTSNIGGMFNGNTFISDPISTGVAYEINITDINGCISGISGVKLCDCNTEAGFISTSQNNLCISDTLFLNVAGQQLDNNDVAYFILHNGSIDSIGTVLDTSRWGIFEYNANYILGETYFVNYAVGDSLGAAIDFSDLCFDLSNGAPVNWEAIPIVNAGDDQNSCNNIFNLESTPAQGEWRVIDQPNGANINFSNLNNANAQLEVSIEGIYELEWSTTSNACIVADTVTIEFLSSPIASNFQIDCDEINQTYVLSFNITSGNPPYTVNGINVNGSTFTSNDLQSNATSTILVEDVNNCVEFLEFGPIDCSCASDIGSVVTGSIELCEGESLDPNISNNDFTPNPGQSLFYVLHDGDANNPGNIVAQSVGDLINYNTNFELNTSYYLNAVLAESINGAIDFSDPCLRLSEGIEVVWIESVDIDFAFEFLICEGDTINFRPTLDSNYPLDLFFESNQANDVTFNLTDSNSSLQIVSTSSEVLTLVKATGSCINNFNGTIEIIVERNQSLDFNADIEICNNPLFGSTVSFDQIFIDPTINIELINTPFAVNNNTIDFANTTAGDYLLEFSTIGLEDPCPGSTIFVPITVIECDCPTFNIPMITLCNNDPGINLNNINVEGFDGEWSLESSGLNPPELQNDMLLFSNADPGLYTLRYDFNDPNYPSSCQPFLEVDLDIVAFLSAGQAIDNIVVCSNETEALNLFNYISGFDAGGIWMKQQVVVNESIDIADLEIGDNTFTYILENENPCPADSAFVNIELIETIELEMNPDDVTCFGANDGTVEFVLSSMPNGEINYYVNDEEVPGPIITNLAPGAYNAFVTIDECASEVIQFEIIEPEAIFVSLGDDQEVTSEEEIVISALTNIESSDINTVSWTLLSEILNIDELELRRIFEESGTITIEIIDINGCSTSDSININVSTNEDIYIPNIFSLSNTSTNGQFVIGNIESVASRIIAFNIFDRWGNKVFNLENIDPNQFNALSWNGTYNDEFVEQGVYVYKLTVEYFTGRQEELLGEITVIR